MDNPDNRQLLELTTVLSSDKEVVTGVKPKRKRRVPQHSIADSDLIVPQPKAVRKRKDKSLRTLYRALLEGLDISTLKRPWMASKSFRLIDTDEDLAAWVDEVLADTSRWMPPYKGAEPCPVVAVDTETTGLDTRILVHEAELFDAGGEPLLDGHGRTLKEYTYEVMIETAGVCLSVDGVSGVYIAIHHERCQNVSREAVLFHLQRLFNVSHLVFYHAKFDREVMRCTLGIVFRDYPHFEDVQVLHFSNDPKADLDDDTFSNTGGGLKALSKDKLGIDQIDLGLIGKVQAEWCPVSNGHDCRCSEDDRKAHKHTSHVQYVPFTWIPTHIAVWYAAADAICTWLLWFQMREEAQSRVRVHKIDGELVDSLTWMERQRFLIAEEPWKRVVKWHTRSMEERRANLRQIANRVGWEERTDDDGNVIEDTQFDVDKKHLPDLLFNKMKLEVVKRSEKTNAPSVDKEAMVDLLKKYPNNEFLLALEEYKKYVALHPENLKFDPHDHTARVYLKQCVVAGGRLAASGGKFDRDGGFGLNVQAIKKVGGNRFVKGRVLDPDFIAPEAVEPREESELHPSCFADFEESVLKGWKQKTTGEDGSVEEEIFANQFPDDLDATTEREDDYGDQTVADKYPAHAPERHREAIYEKRKVRKQVPGIIKNHIANFLGYSICLVPSCTTCAEKHGVLIENGKLDANQIINLRALFTAADGWTFFSTDYSNIEMRVAANVSGEPEFIKEFLEGSGDFHSLTASKVFPEFNDPHTPKALRKTFRDLAKIINFALLYGGTKYTIFENMRKKKPTITMKETELMVQAYWDGVPTFKVFCEELQRIAREEMRCSTATGRVIKFDSAMAAERIHVPTAEEYSNFWNYVKIRKRQREAEAEENIEEAAHLKKIMDSAWKDPESGVRNAQDYNRFMSKIQRVAVNVPLQGLAGDFMRMAINRVRKWATLGEFYVQSVLRMHGSVHDELDYAVKNEYIPFVIPRITRLMKLRKLHALRKWSVPIECDTEYGPSWDVQHPLTGDDDHIPAGWTQIKGLETYLPEDFTPETVDSLVRALVAGTDKARERVLVWAKDNLHPRAFKAFWHAVWYLDRDKVQQVATDAATIRTQVIAACQLHEFWCLDETGDDEPLLMETLEQYEARRGLTVADRGFMPLGGFLGSLPVASTRRPPAQELGEAPIPTEPQQQPTPAPPQAFLFPPVENPAVTEPEAPEPPRTTETPTAVTVPTPLPPPPVLPPSAPEPDVHKVIEADEMVSDDLDELLGRDRTSRFKAAPVTAPVTRSIRRKPSAPPVVQEKPAALPNVRKECLVPALRDWLGIGDKTVCICCEGRFMRLTHRARTDIPEGFLEKEAEIATAY